MKRAAHMRRTLLCAALVLQACAATPPRPEPSRPEPPLRANCPPLAALPPLRDPLPESFRRAWPEGTQRRSLDNVQLNFDRAKSSFYVIFDRYSRGQDCPENYGVNLALAIGADGAVAQVSVLQASASRPALDEKLLQRIRMMNFGAVEGEGYWTFAYPFRFLPTP